jgi:transglutaminase-like putative cysteine protease
MAHLLPRNTPTQSVVSATLDITPEPAWSQQLVDHQGNTCDYFSLMLPHEQLSIQAHSVVDTTSPASPWQDEPVLPWELARAHFEYRTGLAWDAANEYCFASRHVQPHDDFLAYANKSFEPHRSLTESAVDLMQRMHRDFAYVSHATDIHTPALEALARKKGVCQDFAHIMLSCFRSLGLAARYVSGYLLTDPPAGQPRLIGSDASHAWVSLYVPAVHQGRSVASSSWLHLDPTNNRVGMGTPGDDYVCVAWGRDFADVSPVRGVIQGGARQTLEVGVTVTPVFALTSPS